MATINDLNLLLNILNEDAVSAESRQFLIFTPQIRILEARMLVLWNEDYNSVLYSENEYYY